MMSIQEAGGRRQVAYYKQSYFFPGDSIQQELILD